MKFVKRKGESCFLASLKHATEEMRKMKVKEIVNKVLDEKKIKGNVEVAVYECSGDESPYTFDIWANGKDWWVLREGYERSDWIFEEEAEDYQVIEKGSYLLENEESELGINIWLSTEPC